MAVTKTELVNQVAKELGLPKSTVKRVLDRVLDEIEYLVLEEGQEVLIRGFGKFKLSHRSPRRVITPQGKEYRSKEHYALSFSASKKLRTEG